MDDTTESKQPPLDFFFWVMKICATTLGETAGDLLSMTLSLGYAASTGMLMTFFLVVLALQLRVRLYHPLLYWSVILATSTAGTTTSDFMDRTLGLGYARGSAILIVLLVTSLLCWQLSEGSLSVQRLVNRRAELFYWVTVLISNTLGTAMGDYLSDDSGLGFAGAAVLVGSLLAVISVLYFRSKLSHVLLFWAAFVLTRPFGAELGDLLTKDAAHHGLGLGTIYSSLVLAAVLLASIAYVSLRGDKQNFNAASDHF